MSITLTQETFADIKQRQKNYGFNFSEWITNEYYDQFMSIDSKKTEIRKCEDNITKLTHELQDMITRQHTFEAALSRPEKRFLLSIPRLVAEGKEWNALANRFNTSFNKKYTTEQLRKTVQYLMVENERAQKRR